MHIKLEVGSRIQFEDDRYWYTVQAVGTRYAVVNRPHYMPPWKRTVEPTTLYAVLDFAKMQRGPENLVFGFGAETRNQCHEMMMRLEAGSTEISYRRKLPLRIYRYASR